MALLPDTGRLLQFEKNVDLPAGLGLSGAYDLALYPELGTPGRAVLVLTMIAAMTYKDGKDTSGAILSWTAAEKTKFATDVSATIQGAWAEKHRITTISTALIFSDVGVIFDLKFIEGLSVFSHSHRNITVTKVGATKPRSDTQHWLLELGRNNIADWYSADTVPLTFPSGTQRPCVHEFGHVLGYRDEYVEAGKPKDNPNWVTDLTSVMNSGEVVRDRHYALLADWLTRQFVTLGALRKTPIEFKVNGVTDLVSARIG